MIRHKRLIRNKQHKLIGKTEKAKTRMVFGVLKQFNEKTGKYDINA